MEGLSVIMAAMDRKKLQDKLNATIAEAREIAKIGKCKNCRHWRIGWPNGAFCNSPKVQLENQPEQIPPMFEDQCLIVGGERMYTGPEFGCLHFEDIQTQ